MRTRRGAKASKFKISVPPKMTVTDSMDVQNFDEWLFPYLRVLEIMKIMLIFHIYVSRIFVGKMKNKYFRMSKRTIKELKLSNFQKDK